MAIPTIKPDGTLTDYGKMLKNQEEAQKLASTYKRPEGFKEELGMYGGFTPTYEAYAAQNVGMGNSVLGRDEWEQSLRTSNQREFMDREGKTVQGGQQPTQQTPQTTTTSTTSTHSTSNVYDAQSQLLINQLKQKIAQARSEQEGIISRAPQQFDPLRSQSELAKGQQLRQVLERNANLGDRGGVGRSAALQTQTAGENRLNTINLQQQNVIDTANQRIADLEAQGRFEEANILAQQRIAELQDAMAQQRLMEQRAYDESLRAQEIARQDQLRQEGFAREDQMTAQEQERQDFQTSIMANYSDLSAYRDRLRAQGAPQWQIDQVEAARLQKIMEQNLDPRTGQPLPVDNTSQIWNNAMQKWNAGIPLTQQEMQVIGAPTPVKPKPVTSGGSGGTTTTQERNFQLDRWERLGVADEEVARVWGVPVGTKFDINQKPEPEPEPKPVNTSSYEDYINRYFVNEDPNTGRRSLNRQGTARYIYEQMVRGDFDVADRLMGIYGISEQEIEVIERSMGNRLR